MSRVYEAHRNGTYQGKPHAIEIDDLKELCNGQVHTLARHLLPNGRENCGFWEVGSIAGEKGQSLKLNLRGNRVGLWTDFSAAKGSPGYSGNLIQLTAQVMFGGDVGDAIRYLKSWLGLDDLDPDRLSKVKAKAQKQARDNAAAAAKEKEKTRGKAHHLFISAVPIPGTPAENYLCARGIDLRALGLPAPGSLRFHADAWCSEAKRKMPAMVASIIGLDGKHLSTHRTYLRPDGRDKADLAEAKKSWGAYADQGGFIQLWKGEHKCPLRDLPKGTPIYMSEGIEDGLSVAIARPSLRVIAAVSLANMRNVALPEGCPLYILTQRFEEPEEIDSFEAALAAHEDRGQEVYLVAPPAGYKDYNEPIDRRGGSK